MPAHAPVCGRCPGLRGPRATDGPTDRLAAGRTDRVAQKAGKRRDSDMTGHIQQPGGRGNPGPTSSPSPGPGPGPGTTERVALKKEIGLVSACTIIIGERGAHRVESSGDPLAIFPSQGQRNPLSTCCNGCRIHLTPLETGPGIVTADPFPPSSPVSLEI